MIEIDSLSDESLQEILERLVSGLLPHENYDPVQFNGIVTNTLKYISLDELKMEYRVVFGFVDNLRKMQKTMKEFVPYVSKANLMKFVEANIYSLVVDPRV